MRTSARLGRRERTLAAQFLVLQLAVVGLLLLIVAIFSVRQSTSTFTDQQGAQMRSVANYVASFGVVRCQLGAAATPDCTPVDGQTSSVLAPSVDSGLRLSGATEVLIAAPDGEVLAASDPSLVGTAAAMGDSDVQDGVVWTGDVEVDGARAIAAHSPVIGDDGSLRGFSIAQQNYPTVWERLTSAAPDLSLFLGLGALLGGVGTYVVSRVVKRRTQGLGSTEIANLADHRQALLHSIREGVVAVDVDGVVTMMNDAARATLGLEGVPDPVGRRLDELGLDAHVAQMLGAGVEVADAVALVGTRVVVFNRRAASSRGQGIGSVTTMRDRTELAEVQSQLSSNLSITDTLRAQTHEFDNRLHTISGLVQLGEYDEVAALVGTITRRRSEIADFVSARVHDPAVAALLVAKDSVAAERGVALSLDPGSRLPALAGDASADLTTVLGNLVDNALDSASERHDVAAGGPVVEVWLTVEGDPADVVHVRVRDNGDGVPEEMRESIFVRGFSTKPDVPGGRGLGLPLVKLVCTQRGGRVEVDRAAEEGGAEFHVSLPVGQGGRS